MKLQKNFQNAQALVEAITRVEQGSEAGTLHLTIDPYILTKHIHFISTLLDDLDHYSAEEYPELLEEPELIREYAVEEHEYVNQYFQNSVAEALDSELIEALLAEADRQTWQFPHLRDHWAAAERTNKGGTTLRRATNFTFEYTEPFTFHTVEQIEEAIRYIVENY